MWLVRLPLIVYGEAGASIFHNSCRTSRLQQLRSSRHMPIHHLVRWWGRAAAVAAAGAPSAFENGNTPMLLAT